MRYSKIQMQVRVFDIAGLVFTLVGLPFFIFGIFAALHLGDLARYATGDVRLLPIIFIILGTVFLILGIIFLRIGIKQRALKRKLIQNGFYITATIRNVYPKTNVSVNGKNPYVVECYYNDYSTGQTHIFTSGYIPFYPEGAKDTGIRVYVDPQNMDKYYVDIDSLLNNVVVH